LKFVIDGMLGKLARWLRMMGHDVEYSNSMDDSGLLTIAEEEHRILLTRDFALYQHAVARGVEAFYVEGQTQQERLAELATRFGISLEIDMATSRCPRCNTQVKLVPIEKIVGRVEKNTLEHNTKFWECPECGQVYWQGAHWTKIRETLEISATLQKLQKGSV
jgi:uncharacterized protein with PIN domain